MYVHIQCSVVNPRLTAKHMQKITTYARFTLTGTARQGSIWALQSVIKISKAQMPNAPLTRCARQCEPSIRKMDYVHIWTNVMLHSSKNIFIVVFKLNNPLSFSRWSKLKQTVLQKSVSKRLFRFEKFRYRNNKKVLSWLRFKLRLLISGLQVRSRFEFLLESIVCSFF